MKKSCFGIWPTIVVTIFCCSVYGYLKPSVWGSRLEYRDEEMVLSLPVSVQLLLSGGDRYLAANIGVFRSQTSGVFEASDNNYRVLAETQLAAALLNPYHEDNYWTVGANLSWNNQVPIAQDILMRAANARVWDEMPLFFHGFNRFYFEHNMLGAAQDAQLASLRTKGGQNQGLLSIASRWAEKDADTSAAISLLQGMLKNTADKNTKRLISARVTRLEGLILLRDAVKIFRVKEGRSPDQLEELVDKRYLKELPQDPFRRGYGLDEQGQPVVLKSAPKR